MGRRARSARCSQPLRECATGLRPDGGRSGFREGPEFARSGRMTQLLERLRFNLPNPFPCHAEGLAHLLKGVLTHAADPETHAQDTLLARSQAGERLDDMSFKRVRFRRRMRVDGVWRLDQVAKGGAPPSSPIGRSRDVGSCPRDNIHSTP